MKLTSLSLGLVGLAFSTGCLTNEDLSSTEQEIKGRNKAFVGKRLENKVSVYDQDGEHKGDMTGGGLTVPFGIHVEGDDVYVVSQGSAALGIGSSVYAHLHEEGETGANRLKLKVLVPIGAGLAGAFYPTVRDGVLYVSSGGTGQVRQYDAQSGAAVGSGVFASTNLAQPRGLDFDSAGNLYVASHNSNQVQVFDASGTFLKTLATPANPCGISISADDIICAGSAIGNASGGVTCWDTAGTQVYRTPNNVGSVCGVDFGRDGRLYATRPLLNAVQAVDISSGAVETFYAQEYVTGVQNIAGVAWGVHADE